MHTESMDKSFLDSVVSFFPAGVNSLANAQQAVRNVAYGSINQDQEAPLPNALFRELAPSSYSVHFSSGLAQQAILDILNHCSPPRGIFILRGTSGGFLDNDGTIALIPGRTIMETFANTPEHERLFSDLLLSESLPWVCVSD